MSQLMVILDKAKNTQNKRGRTRQAALDKWRHPVPPRRALLLRVKKGGEAAAAAAAGARRARPVDASARVCVTLYTRGHELADNLHDYDMIRCTCSMHICYRFMTYLPSSRACYSRCVWLRDANGSPSPFAPPHY